MDDQSLMVLVGTAAFIGFVHTLTGPDHYVPFIALARASRWPLVRTSVITIACGIAHVASSVVLAALGIVLGWTVFQLRWLESVRGRLALWLLLGFGLAYTVWGIRHAVRKSSRAHWRARDHVDADGRHGPVEAGAFPERAGQMTPWVLFMIFVFGPCEPLIPILMYPAAGSSWWGLVAATLAFALCTLVTMTALVIAGYSGSLWLPLGGLERYSHALAGLAVLACGVAITLGL